MQLTIETLKQLPEVQKMMRDQEQVALAERSALIQQLADVEANEREELEPITAAIKDVITEIEGLNSKLRQARVQHEGLVIKSNRVIGLAKREKDALKQNILAGADPRIHQFKLWAMRAKNLANFASHFAEPLATNVFRRNFTAPAVSVAGQVNQLVKAALTRAEQMEREALSAAEVSDNLEAIAGVIYEAMQGCESQVTSRLSSNYMDPLY